MAARDVPKSIIVIGTGVFGLSTSLALANRKEFIDANTEITVLERLDFPAPDASSVDCSRIIRAEYPDSAYAELMAEAHQHWRGHWGEQGRYTESGLCIAMDEKFDGAHDYISKAVVNVRDGLGLKEAPRDQGGQVQLLDTPEAVKSAVPGMTGSCGQFGYVNWTAGWAHATDALTYARHLCLQTNRIKFRTAELHRIHFSPSTNAITSLELTSGERLTADLTILATGAWTPSLIDLRGVASATGQVLTYIPLTPSEQTRLEANPTLIKATSGMFIIPPRDHVLKIARHGYGYANPTTIPHPEDPSLPPITVSLPMDSTSPFHNSVPAEGLAACREYLALTNPDLADREFSHTRICWYTDTRSGDWLIDYHPVYHKNLFVVTGGSGHGYKFLPVLGERVVDVVLGVERDELGGRLREKWRWPRERGGESVAGIDGHVWTGDWRGGEKGMVLEEEFAKGQK